MNYFNQKLFFLLKLPMAFLSGLRISKLQKEECVVRVKYNYLTKNPFKSMYFACQAMAAELSTGMLCFEAVKRKNISLLVVRMEAQYIKKAVGNINFTCSEGSLIQATIQEALKSGKGETITVKSIGIDENGDTVSEFQFCWSFKKRK